MLRGKIDLGLYNQFENNWPDHRINENKSMFSAAGVMAAAGVGGRWIESGGTRHSVCSYIMQTSGPGGKDQP